MGQGPIVHTVCIVETKGKRSSRDLAFQMEKLRELPGFSKLLHIIFPWPMNWVVERCLGKAGFLRTPAPKDLPVKAHVSLPNLHERQFQWTGTRRQMGEDGWRQLQHSRS